MFDNNHIIIHEVRYANSQENSVLVLFSDESEPSTGVQEMEVEAKRTDSYFKALVKKGYTKSKIKDQTASWKLAQVRQLNNIVNEKVTVFIKAEQAKLQKQYQKIEESRRKLQEEIDEKRASIKAQQKESFAKIDTAHKELQKKHDLSVEELNKQRQAKLDYLKDLEVDLKEKNVEFQNSLSTIYEERFVSKTQSMIRDTFERNTDPDELFKFKLALFEVPALKSADKSFKARLRKCKSIIECYAIVHEYYNLDEQQQSA